MKRKIVQQGKSSLNVSIPNAWIKRHGMMKGDEINIEEKEDNLILSTGKPSAPSKKTLDARDLDEQALNWYLISLYCSGYDELKILFSDHTQLDIIHNKIRNLLGYNIMEQREKYCIVRSISQPVEEELEPSLRRNFQVTLSIAESTYEALKNKDKDAFKSVLKVEDTCNRITYFCLRLLNKKGYKGTSKTTYMHSLISRLENIADAYGDIMKDIRRKGLEIDLSDKVLELFRDINTLLRIFYENFYKPDKNKLKEMAEKVHTEFDRMMEMTMDANPAEQHVIYFLNCVRNYIGESIVAVLGINSE